MFVRVSVYVTKQKGPPVLEDIYEGRGDAKFVRYSLNGMERGVLVAEQN